MKTKVKHIIAIFLIGVLFTIAGAFFKIMHWPGGNTIITIAFAVKILAVILGIWKVLTTERFKSFLNR
ncbi:GldL-related protein [Mesonia aquimarina]|uniref:GldL-related protein n=1 Tax=Mesonia aquimarina TaxID=1504967 RepID=UPI000EF59B78|nr:gliding motility protein GldL [Mesonia aquimarina]